MTSRETGEAAALQASSHRGVLALWLAAGGMVGSHSFVLPGVSIADLALAAAAGLAAGELWRERRVPQPPRWLLWVGAAALWSLVGAVVLAAGSPFGFSAVEFAKSFAKLVFYPAAVFLLGTTVDRLPRGRVAEVLLWVLALNAALAIYIYVVMVADLDLPYRFLWTLSGQGEETARPVVESALLPSIRARGIASEPSTLGWFQVLGLACVFLLAGPSWRPLKWRVLVVLVSVALTFSLTAYGLLGVLGFVLLAERRARTLAFLRHALIPAALTAACLLALPVTRRAFDSVVVTRVAQIATGGNDVSASLRLRSSWEMAAAMVRASPVFGAGLGQYDVALEKVRPSLSLHHHLGHGTQGWNALAYLLGTLGPVGLVCGLLLVWEVWRRSRLAAVMLLAAAFADSTILGAPFWFFYLLLYCSGRWVEEPI